MAKELELIGHYREQLSSVFAERPWLVATNILVSSARLAMTLKSLGVERVLAVGTSR